MLWRHKPCAEHLKNHIRKMAHGFKQNLPVSFALKLAASAISIFIIYEILALLHTPAEPHHLCLSWLFEE